MKKLFAILVFAVMAFPANVIPAENKIIRESWDQSVRDLGTGELTPTYKGEWVYKVNGVSPRAGERGKGEDGREYVWVPAEQSDRMARIGSSPPDPKPGVERRPVNQANDFQQQQLPPPPVPGAKPGGKLVAGGDGMDYYVEPGPRGRSFKLGPTSQRPKQIGGPPTGMGFGPPPDRRAGPPPPQQSGLGNHNPLGPNYRPLHPDDYQRPRSSNRAPLHPNLVPYHLEEGETISNLDRYTTKPATGAILRATGKTEQGARKMKVGEAARIPEKMLKPEYRDPLKKIDILLDEREVLLTRIKELEKGHGSSEQIRDLQRQVKERDDYIAVYLKGSENYVKEENKRLTEFREKMLREVDNKIKNMSTGEAPPTEPRILPSPSAPPPEENNESEVAPTGKIQDKTIKPAFVPVKQSIIPKKYSL